MTVGEFHLRFSRSCICPDFSFEIRYRFEELIRRVGRVILHGTRGAINRRLPRKLPQFGPRLSTPTKEVGRPFEYLKGRALAIGHFNKFCTCIINYVMVVNDRQTFVLIWAPTGNILICNKVGFRRSSSY